MNRAFFVAAAVVILAGGVRAEDTAEKLSASAAKDFDLTGLRDAAEVVDAGKDDPAGALRSMAAGNFSPASEGTRNLQAKVPPPAPPAPKKPSRVGAWFRERVEPAKDIAKVAVWFVPPVAGAAVGGFAGAAMGGPTGAAVGAAVGGAVGTAVTGAALLVIIVRDFMRGWNW